MADSHTPCIAAASRNTRLQAAAAALPGPDLHRLIAPAYWRLPSLDDLSAVASSGGGRVRPSIVAVWSLMTSSNRMDCTTGVVDSCRTICPVTVPNGAYWVLPNQSEADMPLKARGLVLTKSQAACLIALRNGKVSKSEIAIQAKLDLIKTAAALGTLRDLGLRNRTKRKGGIRRDVEKSGASRPFRIDCGK